MYLPPGGVIHIDNLKNVTLLECQASLTTRNQLVTVRIVCKVSFYINLAGIEREEEILALNKAVQISVKSVFLPK